MAKKQDRKQCFVVGPIGDDDSEDRIHADWLLEEIILPVFNEHYSDFDVTRADKISNPGQITTQVISALLEADLVIADLTTLNPNAFYEIGIRHVVNLPIIHMHLDGQRIPFDIAPFRSIKFARRRPSDIRAARQQLLLFVQEALSEGHEIDNPVTVARGRIKFEENATPAERLVQEQLEILQGRVHELEKEKRHSAIVDALQRNLISEARPGHPRSRVRRIKLIVEDASNIGNAVLQALVEKHASSYLHSYGLTPISDENGNLSFEIGADYISDFDKMAVKTFIDRISSEGCNVKI